MSNATSTSGCPAVVPMPIDPVPFFSNGNINFKAHDVGWLVAGVFSVIAMCASFWLINKHLKFFYAPSQQRHIVRILFMVPVYAVTSFLSYFYYNYSLYFTFVQDCYEAIVIASFFNLLVSYLSSPPPTFEHPIAQPYKTREDRAAALQEVFRDLKIGHWMFPFGKVKWRPAGGGPGEGKAFLWLMRLGIGQYVVLVPLTTLITVISQALGDYCLGSYSPKFTHVWMSAIASISVTVAMFCVLQLYMPLKKELAPYKPVLKFLSVKSVVFLTFWQSSALSFLATVGVIKDHQYWSAHEIVIGLNGLICCFEMMIFGFVHISAFSYLPYRALAEPVRTAPTATSASIPKSFAEWSTLEEEVKRREIEYSRLAKMEIVDKEGRIMTKADGAPILQQTRRWPALWKCIALSDIARELGQETGFVVRNVGGRRKKVEDVDRRVHLEGAFGRKRAEVGRGAKYEEVEDPSDDDEGASVARPTARGEDGKAYPSIGRDGRLIDPTKPKGNKISLDRPTPSSRSIASPTRSDPFGRLPVLAYDQEQLLPSDDRHDTPHHDHPSAWWGSLRGKFWSPGGGYDHEGSSVPEFRQVERSTPVVVESMRTPLRPYLLAVAPSAPPPQPYPVAAIAGIPRLSDSQSLELPPPHLLTNNGPFPAPSPLNNGPSPPRPAAQRSRPISLPLLSNQHSGSSSPFSDSSFGGSGNRHSTVQGLPPPPPRAPDRFTAYTPPTRSRRSSAPSEPRGMGEQRSRGLPPGAAPSAFGGSGSWSGRGSTKTTGTTSFIFEEY